MDSSLQMRLRSRDLYQTERVAAKSNDVAERIRDFNLGGRGRPLSAAERTGKLDARTAKKKPLLQQRFPDSILGPGDPVPSPRATPTFTTLRDSHERLKFGESTGKTRSTATEKPIAIEIKLMQSSMSRFDLDFVELRLAEHADPGFRERRRLTVEWFKQCPDELKRFKRCLETPKDQLAQLTKKKCKTKEALLTDQFLEVVQAIYERVHRTPGQKRPTLNIRENGSQPLHKNPTLSFHPWHQDGWEDGPKDVKPDVVSVSNASGLAKKDAVKTYEYVEEEWEMKWHLDTDFASHDDDPMANTVPRMLKYERVHIRNLPVTGQRHTLVLAGSCLRLWELDARSFASSRSCRLDDPEHAEAIVDIIAFLTAPAHLRSRQRWVPDCKGLAIRKLDQQATERFQWANPEKPYLWLDIREALFGSRTTAFAGIVISPLGETLDVVVKTFWTFEELKLYELRMLSHLHGKDTTSVLGPNDPDPEKLVDALVIKNLPKALGEVIDAKIQPESWKAAPIQNRPHNEVYSLCIIVTEGPVGRPLPRRPNFEFVTSKGFRLKLGLKHYAQIWLGVVDSLWYAASRGVHYRDINLGNIMWVWVEDEDDPKEGRAVGYLIDFGNARYLDTPRREFTEAERTGTIPLYALCKDDGRSATPTLCSVHSLRVEAASDAYLKAKNMHDEQVASLTKEYRNLSDDERKKAIQERTAGSSRGLKTKETAMRLECHRYIDDLESSAWTFLYQMVRYASGAKWHIDLESLASREGKETMWADDLAITERMACGPVWSQMCMDMATTIRAARAQITAETPATLTSVENQCFFDCHQLLSTAISNLPADSLQAK